MDVAGFALIGFLFGALFGVAIAFAFVEREEKRIEKEHEHIGYYDFSDWCMRRIERDSKQIDYRIGS